MAPVAEESKALAENILASAQNRQRGITDMKSEVSGFLTHNKMQRLREFRNAHDRIRGRVDGLAEETRRFLAQCNDEQCTLSEELRRAADEQRGIVADGETGRLHAFCQMHARIAKSVAGLATHARKLLRNCQATQHAVAEQLRQAASQLQRVLAEGDEMRLDNFGQLHRRIAGRVAELVAETRGFLGDCDAQQLALEDTLGQAARALRQQLADGDNARLEAFRRMHDRVAGRVAALAQEVGSKLDELHNDLLMARSVWRDLASARWDLKQANPTT